MLKPRFNVHAARVADLQWDVLTPGVSLTQETQETEKKRVGQERTVLCLLRLDQEEWCRGEALESVVGINPKFCLPDV